MYNKLYKDEIGKKQKYFNLFVVIFGIMCGTVSLITTFIEIYRVFSLGEDVPAA